jgi:hypothetical protein
MPLHFSLEAFSSYLPLGSEELQNSSVYVASTYVVLLGGGTEQFLIFTVVVVVVVVVNVFHFHQCFGFVAETWRRLFSIPLSFVPSIAICFIACRLSSCYSCPRAQYCVVAGALRL